MSATSTIDTDHHHETEDVKNGTSQKKKTPLGKNVVWNHTINVGPEHLAYEEDDEKLLKELRGSWDWKADACLEELQILQSQEQNADSTDDGEASNQQSEKGSGETPLNRPGKKKKDLYELFERHHDSSIALEQLWDEVNTVPDWVDWEQIARGQDVFYRYAGPMFVGLTYSSLLGGMGGFRVTEVLARTGGFSTKVVKGRLYETTQFILEVSAGVQSMMPPSMFPEAHQPPPNSTTNQGDTPSDIRSVGFKSTIRVRFLHALVRQRILALSHTHPSYYSVPEFGVPINDLHSIGTIASFAPWLIFRSLPRQGIYPTSQEAADYLAMWRLVAYYIGCPDTPYFATPHNARVIMEVLMMHEIDPSPLGRGLAHNILVSLSETAPAYPSRPFLEASARWINGNDICDGLGLSRPPFVYKVLVAGQCLFFAAWCYINRSFRERDRRQVEKLRRMCWFAIVESKYGLKGERSNYEFKYVPELRILTQVENQIAKEGEEDVGKRKGWIGRGEERRAMKALGVATGVGVVMCWVSWVSVRMVWRRLVLG